MRIKYIFLAGCMISSISAQNNPCFDELYLDLKRKGLANMDDREYDYFTRKDIECGFRNEISPKVLNDLKNLQASFDAIQSQVDAMGESKVDMEAIYGLGRMKSSDPELDIITLSRYHDTILKQDIDHVLDRVLAIRGEFDELTKDKKSFSDDLIVNSITVKDNNNGGYIKTVDREGHTTAFLGTVPEKGGRLVIYNNDGQGVLSASAPKGDGILMTLDGNGKKSVRLGTNSKGKSELQVFGNLGKKNSPAIAMNLDENGNGRVLTASVSGRPTSFIGSDKGGKGVIATYHSSGSRSSIITSTEKGEGAIGLFDREKTMSWREVAKKPDKKKRKPKKK